VFREKGVSEEALVKRTDESPTDVSLISMALSQPSTWNIGLNAWIVQDGNYPDFGVNETAKFAVEFYQRPETALEASNSDVLATHLRGATYQVVGKKIEGASKITVLDIGILVYSQFESRFAIVECGAGFQTELNLGVDPYDFSGHVPALVYSWRITSILRQTAPFLETVRGGRKLLTRDPSRFGYEEIRKTDAEHDDKGRADYVLVCELLPIPAK
jgi:hypothetical protein